MSAPGSSFDPWDVLGALERHRVNYVLIGDLAGVLHGTDEVTDVVEICPQLKDENLERLAAALEDLDVASATAAEALRANVESTVDVPTRAGQVVIAGRPEGSSGWDDLRRGSAREPLGRGVRAAVASVDDLARLMTSRGRSEDLARLATLRRIAELDRHRGIER